MNLSRSLGVLRRALVAATLFALVSAGTAGAATFTVNTTADTTVANGCTTDPACSLRDAFTAANTSPDANDEIVIPEGTFTLGGTPLSLISSTTSAVTITGQGAGKTIIDGNNASRVMSFDAVDTTVRNLTITGGRALSTDPVIAAGDGGGVAFRGTLDTVYTFDKVDVSGNTAQLSGGGLSGVLENPAAPVLVVTDSTISGNKVLGGMVSAQGGGIFTPGDATITNTTISGNTLDSSLAGSSRGAGIAGIVNPASTSSTTIKLVNSTVVNNSIDAGAPGTSYGGGYAGDAPGGLTTQLLSTNSIIAGNTFGGAANDCGMGMSLTVTSENSISSDASCGFMDEGSLQNTDPKLGPLADNGGPTKTHLPAAGSPTFDAGFATDCPTVDQRGTARPQAKACDIGAVEIVPAADLTASVTASPNPVVLGQNLTYTITVANNGPQPAAGVRVTDQLPAGLTFGTATGGNCGGTPLVCTLPDIPAGASATLTLVTGTTTTGEKTNAVSVVGDYADPNLNNNAGSVTTTVRAPDEPVPPPIQPKLSLSTTITKVKKNKRYRVSARGKLTNTQGRACGGFVLIDVKVKTRRTILRRTPVKANCTYARTFEFNPSRIPRKLRTSKKQLFKVVGNYTGTPLLKPARVIKNVRSKK